MMHYTHLTKIKAHHIHPQSYMQTLNLRGKKNDQEENKGKYFMKIPHTHTHTHTHTQRERERERERERRKAVVSEPRESSAEDISKTVHRYYLWTHGLVIIVRLCD